MESWRIYQDAHGEWRWWKLDENDIITQASDDGFATRDECVADAGRSGYDQE